jgi:hypothetical protein
MVAVSFWSSVGVRLGVYPGVFAKSVEVAWNDEVVKMVKNESVEDADRMRLAGERTAGRVRRGGLSHYMVARELYFVNMII